MSLEDSDQSDRDSQYEEKTVIASQDVRFSPIDTNLVGIRFKDMTREQKKQNNRERQARFRKRNPDRIRSYKDPERYPREPLPRKDNKQPKVRLAKDRPYTEEEKEARRVYMVEYRTRIKNAFALKPEVSSEPPAIVA